MLTLTPKHASGSLRSWTARGQQIPAGKERQAAAVPRPGGMRLYAQ